MTDHFAAIPSELIANQIVIRNDAYALLNGAKIGTDSLKDLTWSTMLKPLNSMLLTYTPCCVMLCIVVVVSSVLYGFMWSVYLYSRADFRFAPSQWETSLQSNAAVSQWLGANLFVMVASLAQLIHVSKSDTRVLAVPTPVPCHGTAHKKTQQ